MDERMSHTLAIVLLVLSLPLALLGVGVAQALFDYLGRRSRG